MQTLVLKETENSPHQEIYNNLGRTRKQSKITDFLKISVGEQNINTTSESEDDIIQPKKRSY